MELFANPAPILTALAFWVLSGVLVGSALAVVLARAPVHSVLFLILCFFNAAGLFLLLGAEFLAMILVVVYVGAVAVLFLFVVMMLDMELVALREGFLRHLPLGALLALVLLAELILTAIGWHAAQDLRFVSATVATAVPFAEVGAEVSNIKMLGAVLYDDYFLLFQASGLVLLVAMIGAIVLTHRTRPGVRRQEIAEQVLRPAEARIHANNPPIGGGVDWDV